ncbi:MAG: ABC transporter substrate-binding protein [Proteobacteria bacterium]|nr:ABC transporter substrate-binding protein [Pseudomonadota bacterium]
MRRYFYWTAVQLILFTTLFSHACAKTMTFSGHDLPPYFFNQNDVARGAFVDTLEKICKHLQYQCTFKIKPVLRVEHEIKKGITDGWVVGVDPSRDDFLIQPKRWFNLNLSFLGLTASSLKVQNIHDLNNTTVSVVSGSTSMYILEKIYPPINFIIIKETSMLTMIKKLYGNRYGTNGLLFGPEQVLISIGKEQDIPIKIIFRYANYSLGVGFSKKSVSAEVANLFNQQLEIMRKNGELKKIEDKWIFNGVIPTKNNYK